MYPHINRVIHNTLDLTAEAKRLLASTFLLGAVILFALPSSVFGFSDINLPMISTDGTTFVLNDNVFADTAIARKFDVYEGYYPDTSLQICGTSNLNYFFDGIDTTFFDFSDYPNLEWRPDLCAGTLSDGHYWFRIYDNNTPTANSAIFEFFKLAGTWAHLYDPEDVTGFISTTPDQGETIATSSTATVAFSLYTRATDWHDDMYVHIKYYRDATVASPNTNVNNLYTVLEDVPIDYAGYFFDDTTASITDIGRYTMTFELRRPSTVTNILSWFGLNSLYDRGLILATTTHFIASTPSAHDNFVDARVALLQGFTDATTTPIDTSSCGIGAFDLSDCFDVLFGWHTNAMGEAFNSMKDGFLSYAPFGYVTRTLEILSSDATTTIPAVSYTFASDFPVDALQNQEFSFNLFSEEAHQIITNDIKSTGDNPLNVWDIFSDIISTLIYVWLFYLIFKDLMKLNNHNQNKNKVT